jgi:hypothetical protein
LKLCNWWVVDYWSCSPVIALGPLAYFRRMIIIKKRTDPTFGSLFFGNRTGRAGNRVGMAGGCIRRVRGSVGCISRVGRFVSHGSMVDLRVVDVVIVVKEASVFKYAMVFFLVLFLDTTVCLFFFVADFGFVATQGKSLRINCRCCCASSIGFSMEEGMLSCDRIFQKLFFLVF